MHFVEFFGKLDEHESAGKLGVGLLRVGVLQVPLQHRDVLHLDGRDLRLELVRKKEIFRRQQQDHAVEDHQLTVEHLVASRPAADGLRQPVVTHLDVDVRRPRRRVDDAIVVVELATPEVLPLQRRDDLVDTEVVGVLLGVLEQVLFDQF